MTQIEILVERTIRTEKTTISNLSIKNNPFKCFTLEDKDRGLKDSMTIAEIKKIKQYGVTAIPTGKYKVSIVNSPRFKIRTPLILGVKGYVGILIHPGNKAEDTLGCLLTGYKHGVDYIIGGTSRTAFEDLMKILDKPNQEITIEIV